MNKLYSGLRSNPINQRDNYSNYESVIYTFNGTVIDKINKKDSQYKVPTAKEGLVYTGLEQILINAGFTTTGTVKYSSDNINWSTTIPCGTNAGTYTFYWKVVGDIDHNDTESTAITTSISKATPTYTAPTAKENLEYTGEAQALLNAGSTNNGTIKYSLDGTNWGTSIPTGTEAQTYTVYWKLEGDANHNDVALTTISVEIAGVQPTPSPSVNFIDLGLPSGTKWADRNLGADVETDYGDYFSWGNIVGHKSSNGSTLDDGYSFSSSNYDQTAGASISASIASNDAEHDAALATIGNNARMVTYDDYDELINNTDNEWTTINGVAGRKFMKKSDHGVYIFFPAAGRFGNTSNNTAGVNVYIWASSYVNALRCYYMLSTSSMGTLWQNDSGYRYYGIPIRAVQ